jgi:hypothetical protein
MRSTLLPLVALLAAAPLAAQTPAPAAPAATAPAKLSPDEEARLLELGKKYTRWFLAGNADSLVTVFNPELLPRMGGIAGIADMMQQISDRAGIPTKLVEEKLTYRNGKPQHWYEAEFSELANEPLVIRWLFDPQGKIIGAGINPRSAAPKPDGI